MRRRMAVTGLAMLAATIAGTACGQTRDVTISYLRAAIGSIDYGGRVSIRAIYDGATGLREATGRHMRGKGFSRFTIIDPVTGGTFDHIYCPQDSRAFGSLLQETRLRPYLLLGYRDRGEDREDAIIVTEARPLPEDAFGDAAAELGRAAMPMLRVVIMDVATSNRTIIANVEIGKPYSLPGSVLTIEREPEASGTRVHVVPAEP